MDTIDKQIISYLGEDGRISNREIARKIGISEGTVRARLGRLIQSGVLRISAEMKIEQMPDKYLAFVGVKIDGRHLTECASLIDKLPSVISTAIVTGRYDLIITVLAQSHQTLVDFVTNHLSHVDGVKDSETYVVLKNYGQWIPVTQLHDFIANNEERQGTA